MFNAIWPIASWMVDRQRASRRKFHATLRHRRLYQCDRQRHLSACLRARDRDTISRFQLVAIKSKADDEQIPTRIERLCCAPGLFNCSLHSRRPFDRPCIELRCACTRRDRVPSEGLRALPQHHGHRRRSCARLERCGPTSWAASNRDSDTQGRSQHATLRTRAHEG
jgi:hypothetical protein